MNRWQRVRLFFPTRFEAREAVLRLVLLPFAIGPAALRIRAARSFATLMMARPSYRRYSAARVPAALSEIAGMTSVEFARAFEGRMRWEASLLWRAVISSRWRRSMRIHGLPNAQEPLNRGKGVVLWVFPCVSSNVAVKQALYEAGHPLTHLSRPSHPFSARPFGRRFVNPVLRRAEVPFLAERVVIDSERTIAALRRLREVLTSAGVVSITVTADASSVEEYPFLGGTLRLASGPVQLAASTGAALLPVFTSGTPEWPVVEIGTALPVGRSVEAVRESHLAAAAWLERRILADPFAWVGWRGRSFRGSPGARPSAKAPGPQAPPAAPGSP